MIISELILPLKKEEKSVSSVNKYPCIGKNERTGLVVAFFDDSVGVVIVANNCHKKNEFRCDWSSNMFTYLKKGTCASIVIENN